MVELCEAPGEPAVSCEEEKAWACPPRKVGGLEFKAMSTLLSSSCAWVA